MAAYLSSQSIACNMKKTFCLLVVLFSCALLQAQYKVTFIVKENTAIIHDSIYVAGTFNNWNDSANRLYLMKPHGVKEKSITLNVKSGLIKYKFHRGNWRTVEKKITGAEVADREIIIRKDTLLMDTVSRWLDQFFNDSWQDLSSQLPDTTRLKILDTLTKTYAFHIHYYNTDSALYYANQALQLVQKMKASSNDKKSFKDSNSSQLLSLLETTGRLMHSLGNYPKALEIRLEILKLAEKEKDMFQLAWALGNIAGDYGTMKDYQSMLRYAKQQDSVLNRLDIKDNKYGATFFWTKSNVATALYKLNNLLSALNHAKLAMKAVEFNRGLDVMGGNILLADIYAAMNQNDSALFYYRIFNNNKVFYYADFAAMAKAGMAKIFQKNNRIDSALLYGRQALSFFENNKLTVQSWGETSLYYIADISPLLAELYKANNQPDSAYRYLKLSIAAKDSLYNTDRVMQVQTLGFNETNRRLQLEQQSREEKQRYDTRIKMYGLISIITGFVVLALVLYRNNRQKQNANALLQSQKQEIETTLGELKNTQKQLIQSEKMASLGELTAGIAHEIQNPLNFVNNFSELSNELMDEMNAEIEKGDLTEAKLIANDIKQNLEKINHHGKRADAIVKGMLQHSRSSSGQKESANINALADEYLRLAYHGLRAKDKSFNAILNTDFDESIGNINIIPQDIGRVILNLITNAFYVVDEKKKASPSPAGHSGYAPTVTVTTKKLGSPSGDGGKVEIRVTDNGNGIPQKILDKIFQPFFTTKPTGLGTGLGLSLSYDIVKAHGGEIKVNTEENKGTEFIILLPF